MTNTLPLDQMEQALDAFMSKITVDGNGGIEFLEEGLAAAMDASGLIAAARERDALRWQPLSEARKDGTRYLLGKFGWTVIMDNLEQGSPEWNSRLFDENAPREYRLFWMTMGWWSDDWDCWFDGQGPSGLSGPTHFIEMQNLGLPPVCTVPPKGWACTRTPGHDGPCAAIRTTLEGSTK